MRLKEKQTDNIIADRSIRDRCVGHYEVLEKVKKLLLLPGTELSTVKQVAEFYEVGEKAIQSLYFDHMDELDSDGTQIKSPKEFLNLLQGDLKTGRGKAIFIMKNNETLEIPNRGLRVFPRRAILRVGMLLRDSEIAKEIRTQNELYKNLQYKYGICVKQRGKTPYIQWIDESEWDDVMKTFCAMCEAYEQSPTEMLQQTTPVGNLKKRN